jgi:DNA-binding response OmpR family regulator
MESKRVKLAVPLKTPYTHKLSHDLRERWVLGCLPVFDSDGFQQVFYALTAHFGSWTNPPPGKRKPVWQVGHRLFYGQVYQLRSQPVNRAPGSDCRPAPGSPGMGTGQLSYHVARRHSHLVVSETPDPKHFFHWLPRIISPFSTSGPPRAFVNPFILIQNYLAPRGGVSPFHKDDRVHVGQDLWDGSELTCSGRDSTRQLAFQTARQAEVRCSEAGLAKLQMETKKQCTWQQRVLCMDTHETILVVDDEIAITSSLAAFLTRAGFEVKVAHDGEEALEQIEAACPDLVVLDVLMPRLNGRDVVRRLRRTSRWIPIILLTQVGEATERAMALEEGADDYLNKPFDPVELVARIHAVLRRVRSDNPPLAAYRRLVCGSLSLDRATHRVWFSDAELSLTPKAATLLEYMMIHPDELFTREHLLDVVWGWDYAIGTRAVDTRVAELRRALGDDAANPQFIETVPGHGYRFVGIVVVAP